MKVFVTGASGFVGAHVAGQLARCPGVEVLLAVRRRSDLWRLHARGLTGRRGHMHLVAVDLACSQDVRQLLIQTRPEVMLHLAHVHSMDLDPHGERAIQEARRVTFDLQRSFIAAGGRRFVAAGSCAEYGRQETSPLQEGMAPRPLCPQDALRAQTTSDVLATSAQAGVEGLVLRLFAPYGPLQPASRTVPRLLTAGLMHDAPCDEADHVCDYTYVEDVARAFVVAAFRPRLPKPQAVYNVCTGTGTSLRQLVTQIAELVPCRPACVLPPDASRPWSLVGDPAQIRADLGWQATCDLADGLRRTLRSMPPVLAAA